MLDFPELVSPIEINGKNMNILIIFIIESMFTAHKTQYLIKIENFDVMCLEAMFFKKMYS